MAVMMTPREKWTDDRLDDLNKKVDQGFADLKTETREGFARMEANLDLRFGEIARRFDEVDRRFSEVDRRFEDVDGRLGRLEDGFFALNRTLWGGGFVLVAAIIGSSAF
jgi:tetrahydromethanopterin S-methyltransferase subunit G